MKIDFTSQNTEGGNGDFSRGRVIVKVGTKPLLQGIKQLKGRNQIEKY